VQAAHGPRVLTAGQFLDHVTEKARHSGRRRVDRTDQPARLDDRLTGQILILQQRQPPAISPDPPRSPGAAGIAAFAAGA